MKWPKEKKDNGSHTDVQNPTEIKNRKTYTTKVIGRELWIYQSSHQQTSIKEAQTIQWPNVK